MTENQKIIAFIKVQKRALEDLLERNRDKFTQQRIDILQAEIDGLDARIAKYL